jgi:hypothetical protein
MMATSRLATLYKAITSSGKELCFSACNDEQAKALASSYFPSLSIASVRRAS